MAKAPKAETPRLPDGSPDWSAIGRRSKRKGKTYERKIAGLLSEFTGVNFRKTPGSGGFNKQGVVIKQESFCGDVICDRADFKFCVEAKNRDTFNFHSLLVNPNTSAFSEWWHQCLEDAKSVDLLPIMFFKPELGEDFVALTSAGVDALELPAPWPTIVPSFVLFPYTDEPISITQLVKVPGQKKKVKTKIEVMLPPVTVYRWKTLIQFIKPGAFFKEV